MSERLRNLRQFLSQQEVDAVIVRKEENQRYFSGFSGGAGVLLVSGHAAVLVTDFRFIEQAQSETEAIEIVRYENDLYAEVAAILAKLNLKRIAFEGDAFTYNEFAELAKQAKELKLKPVELDALRMVKDAAELACLKKAVSISDAAFTHILSILRPGVSELTVAAELENYMRRLGSERPAFETIVASGVRGSLPHGAATEKIIAAGDLVTMDFGAVYEGYHSDITRTVCVGKADDRQREIYAHVLQAQLAGLEALRSGVSGKSVDEHVRRNLAQAGFGKYFGHGLGHGVGLAIHEQPRLSPSSTCDKLESNMVVTVEPGIYIPDWGGVRIEDTVVVTEKGCDVLTASSKDLIEL